jgi:hypothetical protein
MQVRHRGLENANLLYVLSIFTNPLGAEKYLPSYEGCACSQPNSYLKAEMNRLLLCFTLLMWTFAIF